MLELAKAVSFLICILSLYWAAISAFFVPGRQWEERLWLAGFKLLAAAAICFYSGMVFSWPARTNPTAFQRLTSTLPVRLFLLVPGASRCCSCCPGTWPTPRPRLCHGVASDFLLAFDENPERQGCCSTAILSVLEFPVAATPTSLVALRAATRAQS